MGLKELASKLGRYETVHSDLLNADLRVTRLTVSELQAMEKLVDSCSSGKGEERVLTNVTKLVYNLVKLYLTDADGNPLAGNDTEADAAEWPAALATELLALFRKANKLEDEETKN